MSAELNLHKNLIDPEIHDPKGFVASVNNDMPVKSERGELLWEQRLVLLPALSLVSSMAAPPTEVNGAIYILQATAGNLDVNTIAWQSGNIVRYTFNGTPDLSAYSAGDYLKVTTATLLLNNGRFVISTVNDGADWIEVTNTGVSDATTDEASDSPGVGQVTKSNWDGCGQLEWVRYNAVDDKWWYIVPVAGMLCDTIDAGWYTFIAGAWVKLLTLTIISMTTAQREALVPTTPLIVEDTDLDNYFKWSTQTNSWNPF